MSDELQMLQIARSIQKQLKKTDEKITAYMEAKLHLEVCDTKKEKLTAIRAAMGKLE